MTTTSRRRVRGWAAALPLVLAATLGAAVPAGAAGTSVAAGPGDERVAPGHVRATHRVIAYYQTIYATGADGVRRYVDPTPLVGTVSDVNVGAIHLNDDRSLHVNDITADHPELERMWDDLHAMQREGVRVHAFVGGAAPGTFRNLAADFETYYGILRDFLLTYGLDGVDLDIEEQFSLADTERLVRRLRADFGPRFVITLTPVATDLAGLTTFSGGFDYAELEGRVGRQISWYNTQFYCGWGDLRTATTYEQVLANGFTPDRVVAGTVTNPANCAGYVDPATFDATVGGLVAQHRRFGGIFGWEYFNALGPDGTPAGWFEHVREVVGEPHGHGHGHAHGHGRGR